MTRNLRLVAERMHPDGFNASLCGYYEETPMHLLTEPYDYPDKCVFVSWRYRSLVLIKFMDWLRETRLSRAVPYFEQLPTRRRAGWVFEIAMRSRDDWEALDSVFNRDPWFWETTIYPDHPKTIRAELKE